MHQSSLAAMARFVDQHLSQRRDEALRIVDIGALDVCGSYRAIFSEPRWRYVGADVAAGDNVDCVLCTPYDWSNALRSESADVVVSGQALEHVEFFWVTVLQMARIMKPGALMCLIVPSAGAEHRYPVDCWRMYRDGMQAVARWARLDVVEAQTSVGSGFADNSSEWKDSVLIARKPSYGRMRNAWRRVKLEALCQVLARGTPRSAPPGPITIGFKDTTWTGAAASIGNLAYAVQSGDRWLVLELHGWSPRYATSGHPEVFADGSALGHSHRSDNQFFYVLGREKMITSIDLRAATFIPRDLQVNDDSRELGLDVKSLTIHGRSGAVQLYP